MRPHTVFLALKLAAGLSPQKSSLRVRENQVRPVCAGFCRPWRAHRAVSTKKAPTVRSMSPRVADTPRGYDISPRLCAGTTGVGKVVYVTRDGAKAAPQDESRTRSGKTEALETEEACRTL